MPTAVIELMRPNSQRVSEVEGVAAPGGRARKLGSLDRFRTGSRSDASAGRPPDGLAASKQIHPAAA